MKRATKNRAFTLAEVLITLGIIGIVVALTLPSLISRYKKKYVVNNLKTAYSILNQAILESSAENGDYHYWDFTNTVKFAETYIVPYLKTVKVCGTAISQTYKYNSGCFKIMEDGNDGWLQLNNSYSYAGGFGPTYYYKMLLVNSISVGILCRDKSVASIIVDIDGPEKGKSKLGDDVFYFQILNGNQISGWFIAKGSPLIPGSECADGAPHINQSIDKLLDGSKCQRGGCSVSSGNGNGRNVGEACSAVIMKNGWEIPKGYPINF